MKLLIFRTDIESNNNVNEIKSLFNDQSNIINWSIDLEDIDKVLKVEANESLNENDISKLIGLNGFSCEPLTD
jgi:hypothetical protein